MKRLLDKLQCFLSGCNPVASEETPVYAVIKCARCGRLMRVVPFVPKGKRASIICNVSESGKIGEYQCIYKPSDDSEEYIRISEPYSRCEEAEEWMNLMGFEQTMGSLSMNGKQLKPMKVLVWKT